MKDKINVLVVDDSVAARQLITHILSESESLTVVGEAWNGEIAVQMARKLKPDIISMDIHMPVMDGFAAVREIMAAQPTPIVVVSGSLDNSELDIGFNSMRAGALAVIQKPPAPGHPEFAALRDELVTTLKTMADVAVIHHWPSRSRLATGSLSPLFSPTQSQKSTVAVLGIASSTGGPHALATILEQIPATFPVPILIVQHISEGFEGGLAHWLNTLSGLPVEVGRAGQQIEPGRVLIAPSGAHTRLSSTGRIVLDKHTDGYLHAPSADVMLTSLADVYGRRAMGVVLTGMGADGAAGLRAIFDAGGVTLAQDEESSVVFGMPKEAIALGGAQYVIPLKRMARMIAAMAASSKGRGE